MKILLTGATGAVGPLVVKALHDAGYSIRTLSIDPPPAGIWPKDVEAHIGDVTDPTAVRSSMADVDVVIHMAALLHIINPNYEMRKKYERVNVGGTATVIDAAIAAGVKRVVLFSTIAVYGDSEGAILNERSPVRPVTFYAQSKLAAEKLVLGARSSDGQPIGTVLRFGAIYGARIKGNYERLTHALSHHHFIPIGNGLNRRTLVYDKDVGRAALIAGFHPAAAGCLYNVTDGKFYPLNKIIESICSSLGRKPPRFSLPIGPIRFLAGLFGAVSSIIGVKALINQEIVDKYTEDIAVDGSLFQKETGFVPMYDLKTGWDETIEEMRENNCFK